MSFNPVLLAGRVQLDYSVTEMSSHGNVAKGDVIAEFTFTFCAAAQHMHRLLIPSPNKVLKMKQSSTEAAQAYTMYCSVSKLPPRSIVLCSRGSQ